MPENQTEPNGAGTPESNSNSAKDALPGESALAEAAPDLALIRTDLANERTLLAYGRTALMLVATGVSLVKFLDLTIDLVVLGWVLIAFGAVVGGIGTYRFTSLQRRLNATRRQGVSDQQPIST